MSATIAILAIMAILNFSPTLGHTTVRATTQEPISTQIPLSTDVPVATENPITYPTFAPTLILASSLAAKITDPLDPFYRPGFVSTPDTIRNIFRPFNPCRDVTCRGVVCPPGLYCFLQNVVCVTAPCCRVPTCTLPF